MNNGNLKDFINMNSNNFSSINASETEKRDFVSGLSDNQLEIFLNTDGLPEGIDSLEKIQAWLDELTKEQHHIDINVNTESLTQFKGKIEDLKKEVDLFGDFLQRNYILHLEY